MGLHARTISLLAVLSSASIVACSGGGGGGGGGGVGPPATTAPATTPTGTQPTATPTPIATATPGSTPTPTPVATPVHTATPIAGSPYTLPSAGPATLSSFTIDSAPQKLAVTVDGTASGTTPTSLSPAYATGPHVFTVVPQATAGPAVAPYVVSLTQTANGPRTIFYNQNLDTTGKISSVSATPLARRRARLAAATQPRRFALSTAGRQVYDAHRLVVRFAPDRFANTSVSAVERSHGALRAATFGQSTREIVRVVTLGAAVDLERARADFAADAHVTSVDRVRLRYPLATSKGPVYPNDPFFNQQWYLEVIDAQDAWGYGLGSPGVSIAVIDTGYDPGQPEVAPGVKASATIVGGTIASGSATDTDGHGTYVSGIAAAQTNNGAGFTGVSYGASLQEYKVFSDGTNPTAGAPDVAEAIRVATANGAKVILAALGGTPDAGPDPLERDAVAYALANGVTVIAGSGDEGLGALDYPAAYDGVVSVGASAINDAGSPGSAFGAGNTEIVPSYSNAGPALSLVAPGGNPTSPTDTDAIHWIVNAYTTQPYPGNPACAGGTAAAACAILDYGTTPAAAEVAGTAALMLSLSPSLTPGQIGTILNQAADDIGDPREGHGRLNVHRALAIVAGDPSPRPAAAFPSYAQFVAFAYDNSGGPAPHVLDVTYPRGVPVAPSGTFRIADIPVAAAGTYKIGVWADVNGDGIFDAGDYFGSVPKTCAAIGPCAGAGTIAVGIVPANFPLP